ncbi:diaminobutyrate acetyltransferase [Brachybacterium sp. YJGR34]|uniref:diaminobutyrate acetyltransferase n=1 Tax=Brachybacterium sp. YJGR34 TaxID=2059911 RepID=UPI000E0C34BD|nr:diaminobutyrate acetyltransferase [Brachybacterium sp. YJGR34]
MGQLTTPTDDRLPTPRSTAGPASTGADGAADGLEIRSTVHPDGAAMWRIARDSGALDLNTSYAYLLMARDFGATCRLAVQDGEAVGYVLGYLRPDAPEHLFIWQIAVDSSQRGRRIAARLLDALVADLPQVRTLESTITEDNTASQRLFAAFAERHGATHHVTPLFEESHFPDPGHAAEQLHLISDLGSAS